MKQRPILFQGAMVRALLDGTKTQTRRVVKAARDPNIDCWMTPGEIALDSATVQEHISPYGQPGDQLWVRESWSEPTSLDPGPTFYRADYPACVPSHFSNVPPIESIKWKPSIHMRRDQCRIILEITGVRVERLQDISETDSIAEGIEQSGNCNWRDYMDHPFNDFTNPRRSYRSLWEAINGPGSWDANPWVWVVEFKRLPSPALQSIETL